MLLPLSLTILIGFLNSDRRCHHFIRKFDVIHVIISRSSFVLQWRKREVAQAKIQGNKQNFPFFHKRLKKSGLTLAWKRNWKYPQWLSSSLRILAFSYNQNMWYYTTKHWRHCCICKLEWSRVLQEDPTKPNPLQKIHLAWALILLNDLNYYQNLYRRNWSSSYTPNEVQAWKWTDQGLSTSSLHSVATFLGLRPPIFPNEPIADKLLKLLLPSLKFRPSLDFLGFVGLISNSVSSLVLIWATTNLVMTLRQKGQQTGTVWQAVVGLGLLWQHSARVQWAHIWWPHSWTSIVQTWSKHMQHSSASLACLRRISQKIRKAIVIDF